MTVAARLRKLEAEATPGPWHRGQRDQAFDDASGWVVEARPRDTAFIVAVRNLLPLLADLAEAAEKLADEIAESEAMDGECRGLCDSYALPEDELHEDGCPIPALRAALARVADQLDHEEGTT